jgi:hypothetical protein
VLFNKERLILIALTLVALLLAGCGLFGPKSFDIVVRIEPPVEGVNIFVDGVHSATTDADGQAELNVKANAKLTAELEGYTFEQKEIKVTKAGEYVFEIETSPGRKGAIVSVKTVLEDIQVWAGETPFEDLDLPSTVEVVLDDDEEVEVDVDWTAAEEDYDYETAGVYELEGVLVPGEGITNPDNITVKVKVVVEDKGAIVSVKTVLEDIQVWAGETPFEDLDLPSKVEVVLDDDEEVEVAVDWTAAEEDYDYETAGVYELEGVLVPGEGITNPDNITVKVKVVVQDKEPYDDAKDYLADFFADYEVIGPDVDKLTLPTEIDLGDGVTAKVTWESSNPEVLNVDGTINRTAEDVEVTLTGTITIEQAGPEGQAEEDPTVFTITVTVLADPELKAKALVEELEAIDGPKHYSEVADILKLIEDAKEAFGAITGNPALRNELRLRVLGVESKVNETLKGHVQAVLGAINDLRLFDALKAFWDAEEQYREVYWYMVEFMDALEGIDDDAIEPSDVDIIQEELIEKAPQVYAERPIVWDIVGAAMRTKLAGNLSQFKDVLQQHADLFQRLNLEDDDDEYTVLNKYADSIVAFAFPPVSATLDHIQLAIDVANWEAFLDALGDAFDSVERDDLDRAEILFSYLTEYEVLLDELGAQPSDIPDEEDGVMAYFAGLMAHLDLLLDIFEAETKSELWAALHAEGVEFEYLYEKLAEGYLREIGTEYEGKADDSDWNWVDDDFEDRLEQIEGIIQGAINEVNTENLKVILAKFGEFEEEDHEDALWALLIELDRATPVEIVGDPTEALDLDLEDPATGFDPDKLPFYKDALLKLEDLPDKAEEIGDDDVDELFGQIVSIIDAGNLAYDGLFDRWTVEVQSAYLNEIVFVIKALNKAGKAYDGWDDDSDITVNVKVDAEIEQDFEDNIEADPLTDGDGWIQGVWTVTTERIEFDEITEDVVATLTITGPGKEAGEEIEYVAETEPFLVDARPTMIKVEADGETYKSGETISLTLTLQYGDADEPQTVYTYEGSPVVMINWGDASGSQVYNRKATFADGVADGIEFEAWEKGEEVTLVVTIVSDEWGTVTGEVEISVEAGDPETLDAEVKDDGNILITVKDKLGQVVDWFEPEQAEVQLRVKPEVDEGSALAQSEDPSSAKPGVDGVAYVRFVEGSATIEMVGSAFAEKLASEYQGEEDKVVTLIVELVDYDLETEIEWTITTGEPGV